MGNGYFSYWCLDVDDDYACHGSETSHLEGMSRKIAVGAAFDVEFAVDEESEHAGLATTPLSASPSRLEETMDGNLRLLVPGFTALIMIDWRDRAVDFYHLTGAAVAALEIFTEGSFWQDEELVEDLALEQGAAASLHAVPLDDDGDSLAGTLEYTWSVDDATVIEIVESERGRRKEIVALAPGEVTLTISAGGVSAEVEVTVHEAADAGTDTETETDGGIGDSGVDGGVGGDMDGGMDGGES
jgi:hypothetical protein